MNKLVLITCICLTSAVTAQDLPENLMLQYAIASVDDNGVVSLTTQKFLTHAVQRTPRKTNYIDGVQVKHRNYSDMVTMEATTVFKNEFQTDQFRQSQLAFSLVSGESISTTQIREQLKTPKAVILLLAETKLDPLFVDTLQPSTIVVNISQDVGWKSRPASKYKPTIRLVDYKIPSAISSSFSSGKRLVEHPEMSSSGRKTK